MSNVYDIAAKAYDDADGTHSFSLEEAVQAVLTCASESQVMAPASTAPAPMTRLEALKEAGQFISDPEDIARMIELAEWLMGEDKGGERS